MEFTHDYSSFDEVLYEDFQVIVAENMNLLTIKDSYDRLLIHWLVSIALKRNFV